MTAIAVDDIDTVCDDCATGDRKIVVAVIWDVGVKKEL